MKIAKIVASNSHIDYAARVIDDLDSETPPRAADYGFAEFVEIDLDTDKAIGVIYDSKLINPEYANYGPRISPKPALAQFTPDYLNEQGILIGILLLGTLGKDGKATHGVPRSIVPAGQDVLSISPDTVKRFHTDENGSINLHYYSQILNHAGPLAIPLLESIIDGISPGCSDGDLSRLTVLKQSLSWQRTMGAMRF